MDLGLVRLVPTLVKLLAGAVIISGGFGIGQLFRSSAPPRHATEQIYIRNLSTFISDTEVKNAIPAFAAATHDDFAPIWNIDADFHFIGKKPAPKGAIEMDLLDKSDIKGALAYHYVVNGVPMSKVFIATSKFYGYSWTVGFTHELWEMLVDPEITRGEQGVHDTRFWFGEVADPVESDADGYNRRGAHGFVVRISDFITTKWFGSETAGPFDFMNHVQRPFQIDKGGYAQYWDGLRWNVLTNFRKGTHDNAFLLGEKDQG